MAPLRVLHLVGSAQSDLLDELSRLYARDCLASIADPARYEPLIAHVSPGGAWRLLPGADLSDAAIAAAPVLDLAAAVTGIGAARIDVVVPQMFCRLGMTAYRALFDLLGIPYLGNPPAAMALGLHKDQARAVVAAAGVSVPAGIVVAPGQAPPALHELGRRVIVKPVDADNSLGVTLVQDPTRLPAAVAAACEHGSAALIEAFVPAGREVRCGVLERDGQLVVLPLEEYPVNETDRPIRAYADKLRHADGELSLVAKGTDRAWIVDRSDPINEVVGPAAQRCHRALGCRHYSLFDFRIDPTGRPWFLEAGLYCSFARQSVIATMAAATGIPVQDLFALTLGEALGPAAPIPDRSV
jgi:D-alanine-D-alanine ligase